MDHPSNDNPEPESIDYDAFSHPPVNPIAAPSTEPQSVDESLFENYKPRSITDIVTKKQQLQESDAAEAAAIILDGVEPPEFTFPDDFDEILSPQEDYDQIQGLLHHQNHRIRVQPVSTLSWLVTPGAQFIYALVIVTMLGGLIGLAATIESPMLVLVAGIASPILLPICAWKWVRWLDSAPYYYRLLTSLGEDARNLLGHRMLWRRSGS